MSDELYDLVRQQIERATCEIRESTRLIIRARHLQETATTYAERQAADEACYEAEKKSDSADASFNLAKAAAAVLFQRQAQQMQQHQPAEEASVTYIYRRYK